jgi:hypothetical protein
MVVMLTMMLLVMVIVMLNIVLVDNKASLLGIWDQL